MLRRYEGLRYVTDKQMVVLDIGSAYTKYGYAGEAAPRGIIKTEVKCSDTGEIRRVFSYEDEADLYQLLVDFFHILFFKHVVITPKDVRLTVLESILTPSQFRNTLAKVLFRHYEIGSLTLLSTHMVTISALGIDTLLVLDVGFEEAQVIPIFEGVQVLKAWQALPLAARAVHDNIRQEMKSALPVFEPSEETIEDVKVRTCFVTTMERAKKLNSKEPPAPPPSVHYPMETTIKIPGYIREKAFESLWFRDNDNLSIPTMILDAIVKCPIDTRRALAENILLIGGTTMAKGFASRLKSELLELLKSDLYAEKLKINTFKFHTAPAKPNYTAWLGAAIFGVADLPSRSLSKENYLKINRVPDWNNLMDNQKQDSQTISI